LTYTYLIELFPYYVRTKGVSWFQLFGKSTGFFSTFVNPIALDAIAWKYLIVFICFLVFEIIFIYFMFPETHNRTLEELAFRKFYPTPLSSDPYTNLFFQSSNLKR
jgi:MFS family permease